MFLYDHSFDFFFSGEFLGVELLCYVYAGHVCLTG